MRNQWMYTGPATGLPMGCFAVALLLGLVIAAQFGLVAAAFEKLGLTAWEGILVIGVMLMTSRVTIPLYRSSRLVKAGSTERTFNLGGLRFTTQEQGGSELVRQSFALSVGGVIIPGLVSAWLLTKTGYTVELVGPVLVTTVASMAMSVPRPGLGFGVPFFGPTLATMLGVYLLAGTEHGPAIAWIAGTMGTVFGASVIKLFDHKAVEATCAEIVIIGGPGVFGAALLAGLFGVLTA